MDLPPAPPSVHAEQFVEALANCGLSKDGIVVTYEDYLQGYAINISAKAGAKPENLECIWQAAHFEFVQFDDPALDEAFRKLTENRYLPEAIESVRKSLADKGLLDKLPRRADFASDSDFARALEVHCGFAPGSALEVRDETITLRPSAIGKPVGSRQFDKFSNLLAAMMLAAAEDGSLKIGFTGNEAFAVDEEK